MRMLFIPQASLWVFRHEFIKSRILKFTKRFQSTKIDGMTKEEFNRHGASVATAAESSKGIRAMVDFVAQQFQAEGKMWETRQQKREMTYGDKL
jgi:hypothetical protein